MSQSPQVSLPITWDDYNYCTTTAALSNASSWEHNMSTKTARPGFVWGIVGTTTINNIISITTQWVKRGQQLAHHHSVSIQKGPERNNHNGYTVWRSTCIMRGISVSLYKGGHWPFRRHGDPDRRIILSTMRISIRMIRRSMEKYTPMKKRGGAMTAKKVINDQRADAAKMRIAPSAWLITRMSTPHRCPSVTKA